MTRPSGSTSSRASALKLGARVVSAATAGGGMTSATTQRSAASTARNTTAILERKPSNGRSKPQWPTSADGRFELGGRLEARRPAGHDDGVARLGIAQRAGTAAGDGERPEADERDGLAAPERAAHGHEHGAEGALGGGSRPAGRLRHPHDEVGAGHGLTCRRRRAPPPS